MYLADAEGGGCACATSPTSVILSRSGLTRLVDRLERDGLLVRESCLDDARGSFAKLTGAGCAKLRDGARHPPRRRPRAVPRALSRREQELLGDLLGAAPARRAARGAARAAAVDDARLDTQRT